MKIPAAIGLLIAASSAWAGTDALVPEPESLTVRPGQFVLPAVLRVSAPVAWQSHLDALAPHIERLTSGGCRLQAGESPQLVCQENPQLAAEAYRLTVTERQIELEAATLRGLAHATATLLQLLGGQPDRLPLVQIEDRPQVSYRNFMIDMGRNPHSFALLQETIDLLWFYKIDSLQLHLTDDQRFAWPSTAYPKLWDGKITLEQFRQLEAYAVARGVTIIPELEVPGHSGKLRSLYPDVFGKQPADLATSPQALVGIKTLLEEMLDVFQATPWIHVGGDEAYGVPEEAQRDLINRLHAYLHDKGRQTMVWEGPRPGTGDNKVHPDVIHINWRTIAYPADQMLRDGYRVVNAAWDPLYIVDHYPRINFTMTAAQHVYETLQLTRFKHVNPGIPTFARPIEVPATDRLIGFCMPWWEGREENFFPQNVPRLIPFADVAWHPERDRDYQAFAHRAAQTEAVRRAAFYPVTMDADLVIASDGVFHDATQVRLSASRLSTQSDHVELRYTTDGSQPVATSDLYQGPVRLQQSAVVRAAAFVDGRQVGHGSRRKFTAVQPVRNLALGKPVTSTRADTPPFSVARLTDGGTGNLDFYLGYPAQPQSLSVTVDLEQPESIGRVTVHAYSVSNSFEKYRVEVSADGQTFESVGSQQQRPEQAQRSEPQAAAMVDYRFPPREVRFIRVVSSGNHGYVFDSFSKLVEIQAYRD